MIQFSHDEIQTFRERVTADDAIIGWLHAQNQAVIERPILVPATGIATWNLYYFCPDHSVRLDFDWGQPHRHRCPVDGAVFSGEPYDGAWWVAVNENNARAVYHCGLLWQLTEDRCYLEKAKAIILQYAAAYPHYEVHGNIPHNKPGRIFSQSMSDALWTRNMAFGYDLIQAELTPDERTLIENDLLIPSAEYLKIQRMDQNHNHEVIVSTAIASVAMLTGREDLLQFAVYAPYGLRYQLEHSLLADGFWFEGTLHYHFYALEQFVEYEKFARRTPHRLIEHPNYRLLFDFPFRVIHPDGSFPQLNDDIVRPEPRDPSILYEFAYGQYGVPEYAWLLNQFYNGSKRLNLNSFFYGAPDLAKAAPPLFTDYHQAGASGLTVFRGSDRRFLLIKHAPFGGEHDHYDRLAISFEAFGDRIAPDLGTTGYGAKLHYDFYKNTGTHNTVTIHEANQPPANPKILRYERTADSLLLDTEVRWDGTAQLPNCHTRIEWDEPSYSGVAMRRIIVWCERYFIDIFKVDGVANRTIDWSLHVRGNLLPAAGLLPFGGQFSAQKPFKYFKAVHTRAMSDQPVVSEWELPHSKMRIFSLATPDAGCYHALAPDNPATQDLSFLVQRITGTHGLFVNVFEVWAQDDRPSVDEARIGLAKERVSVAIISATGVKEHLIRF